jgi:hypothetical protein
MRTMIAAILLATLAAGSNALAMPIAGGAGATADSPRIAIQYWRGGYCERLRRACVYKEERGEVGEGNCRRYRAECGRRLSRCEQLRRACLYKEERREVGEGNCRRYRHECRGY